MPEAGTGNAWGCCHRVARYNLATSRVGWPPAPGPAGSGHDMKRVNNGTESGLLQVIGEGVDLFTPYRAPLDPNTLLSRWNSGSLVRC